MRSYKDLEALGGKLGLQNFSMTEAGARSPSRASPLPAREGPCSGTASRSTQGGERGQRRHHVEKTDIHGYHVVQPGESPSKIAKVHLDDANRHMDIFNANKDQLKDPNLIHPARSWSSRTSSRAGPARPRACAPVPAGRDGCGGARPSSVSTNRAAAAPVPRPVPPARGRAVTAAVPPPHPLPDDVEPVETSASAARWLVAPTSGWSPARSSSGT